MPRFGMSSDPCTRKGEDLVASRRDSRLGTHGRGRAVGRVGVAEGTGG